MLALSFLPVTDGKLIRLLKRIRQNKHASGAPSVRYGVNYGLNFTDAAVRAKQGSRYGAADGMFGMITRVFARFIFISGERREFIQQKLTRAGYKVKAEEFYAGVILRVIGVYMLIPLFILLYIKVAAAATIILGVGLYYKWIGEPDARLKHITAEISDELPRFVSVLNYSMATDRDLVRTINRYIKIAKPALKNELELLLLEMKAGNNAEALRRFDERIGLQQLSAFVSGLIDAGRGIDQKTFFYLMEENMKQFFIENRKKELSRRPLKVKKAIISVGLCMFLLYLVPICMQLINGLSMFK